MVLTTQPLVSLPDNQEDYDADDSECAYHDSDDGTNAQSLASVVDFEDWDVSAWKQDEIDTAHLARGKSQLFSASEVNLVNCDDWRANSGIG